MMPVELAYNKMDPADRDAVAARLLAHYDRHARTLPWRAPPGDPAPDPYRVWLSEIMLQQTTVAAVKPYFATFTRNWPDVHALADADEAAVMAAWAGLGYYARARNLIACARAVSRDLGGRFPDSEVALRNLPGIGAYTAAAIAAIAFGQRAVVIDANVERVAARLCAIAEPLPGAMRAIRAVMDQLTPDARAGDFAQAMMDLGATVCTSRTPDCAACPLRPHCRAAGTNDPARFPVKAAKAERPVRNGTAWWIERSGSVWLVRRPPRGLLGGMLALPGTGWTASLPARPDQPPFDGPWRLLDAPVRHIFTHFALDLAIACVTVASDPPDALGDDGQWWPVRDLDTAGLPGLYRRAVDAVRAQSEQGH
jgi:A/G-specific adenine glycosylase